MTFTFTILGPEIWLAATIHLKYKFCKSVHGSLKYKLYQKMLTCTLNKVILASNNLNLQNFVARDLAGHNESFKKGFMEIGSWQSDIRKC